MWLVRAILAFYQLAVAPAKFFPVGFLILSSFVVTSLMGAYTKAWGSICFLNRCPVISCFLIDLALLGLSSLRVPNKIMASPFSLIFSVMNRVVGLIFRRSVHHLNILVGDGYPLPATFSQKVSSSLGLVLSTRMGKPCSTAAFSTLFKVRSMKSTIRGFSTNVSLHTT